jgi:D-inositol-3-phosphate glycosyltransferase
MEFQMKVLWIGDAACDSGFAKATHYTLDGFVKAGHEIEVLGLNYRGDKHPYPYHISPAWAGGDLFGVKRVHHVMERFPADVVVIQNDPWNIPRYVEKFDQLVRRPFLVGAIAVDGLNCMGHALNGLDHVIFWTKFAQDEAIRGGLTKPSSVITLGVDLDVYQPYDRQRARRQLLPDHPQMHDGFWVINVNRNQPRKRLDLTIQYFAEWMHSYKIKDAYLYLHVCPTGDVGIDCDQLAGYYGLKGHMILSEPDAYKGASELGMARTYQAADAYLSTTHGEGMGLTTLEAMACGLPCVVPNWSALGDWAWAANLVPCTGRTTMWGGPNVIGGVPDKDATIRALHDIYESQDTRGVMREQGILLANDPKFRWWTIAAEFEQVVRRAYLGSESSWGRQGESQAPPVGSEVS